METARQPFVHDLITTLSAPSVVLSERSGQIRASGAQGVFVADRRALSEFSVTVNGIEPDPIQGEFLGGPDAAFSSILTGCGDPGPDPTIVLRRFRESRPTGMTETFRVESAAAADVTVVLEVRLVSDLADIATVKRGHRVPPVAPRAEGSAILWGDDDYLVRVTATPSATVELGADHAVATWTVELKARQTHEVTLQLDVVDHDRGDADFTAPHSDCWSAPHVVADDHRIARLVDCGLRDLRSLVLLDDGDPFLAAGSPWFLTLFGRDSLWAARMMLPLGTDLAMGTLRTLARRQGRIHDLHTEEQPGKILHEVRRKPLALGDLSLPPVYYGTVDATPLWILLLGEAWRWGADPVEIEALLPALEAALSWMRDYGDSDGDGFLEYIDHTGHGLGNQGWKDSDDSVQWADGTLADSPVALCEVQGYAYAAAVIGADLLDGFGRPGAAQWRAWADNLGTRFRAQFWTDDDRGPYVGIALDRDKRLVNTVASNMAHLLGTGILSRAESALVAGRLAGPDLDSGHGLRTMTSASPRYGPLSYHGGSVWPHDTAIAMTGLAADGHSQVASALISGLLTSAADFDYRLPELYTGYPATQGITVPYPAACRPQAWAAAAGISTVASLFGIAPNAPERRLSLRPLRPSPVGELTVLGLRIGGDTLDLTMSRDGDISVVRAPTGLDIEISSGDSPGLIAAH